MSTDGASLIALLHAPHRLRRTAEVATRFARGGAVRRVVLVVNNPALSDADLEPMRRIAGEVLVLRHDNAGQEFGGYQAGVDALAAVRPRRVVILNDTVGSHRYLGAGWLEGFRRMMLAEQPAGFVVGDINTSERRLGLAGNFGSRWIRSNLIGLDDAALAAIGYCVYDPALEAQVRATADRNAFFGPAVDRAMRQHVARWLFEPGPDSWYAAEPLTAGNAARMAAKARAILHEQALSMRLDAAGVAFREPLLSTRQRWSDRVGQRLFRPHLQPPVAATEGGRP